VEVLGLHVHPGLDKWMVRIFLYVTERARVGSIRC
jgi:hypothetical protein